MNAVTHSFASTVRGLLFAAALPILSATPVGAQLPIPVDEESSPHRDYINARAAFERATSLEVYERAGCRSAPWDEQAVAFLEAASQSYAFVRGAPGAATLERMGVDVAYSNCDDPMIRLAYGRALREQRNKRSAERFLGEALATLQDRGYPNRRVGEAAAQLAAFLDCWNRNDESTRLKQLAVEAYSAAIKAGEYGGDAQRFLVADLDIVFEFLDEESSAALCRFIQTSEQTDEWTKNVAWGHHHIETGWRVRGTGFAHTVSDEAWRVFEDHLTQARGYLERALEQNPNLPEPAVKLIVIAMTGYGRESEDERYWFDRAAAAAWDWGPAYNAYEYALSPRWGGSRREQYLFGLECAGTERYDTPIPDRLLSILLEMGEDSELGLAFFNQPGVYENARDLINTLLELRADPRNIRWLRSQQAAFAWAVEAWDDCQRALEDLDGTLTTSVTTSCRTTERRIRHDVALHTSDRLDVILKADKAAANGAVDAAIEQYLATLEQLDSEEELRLVVRDRLVSAVFARDYPSQEWIDLPMERGLPGWEPVHGVWQASFDEDAIRGGPDDVSMMLLFKAPVGDRWELRGRIKTGGLQQANEGRSNAGIITHGAVDYLRDRCRVFLIFDRQNKAVVRGAMRASSPSVEKALEGKRRKEFTFLLQMWGDEIAAYVDDQLIFAGEAPSDPGAFYGRRLGVGGHYWYQDGFARFEDLQIRQLAEPPAALREHITTAEPRRLPTNDVAGASP